jgi:hypothetical protein
MVCEHPDWDWMDCYREVAGIEYKLLERLCDKHKTKILAMEITHDLKTTKTDNREKPTIEQMRNNLY